MNTASVDAAKAAARLDCPPLEQALVGFIHDLEATALTPSTRAAASCLLRDQLAVQIGSARLPWSRQILEFALARRAPGISRIVASPHQVGAVDAAFVNAIYGHGFEYDDAHRASASHPGCCVVPAALALGEALGSSLDEVLVAIVAGYEAYTGIGCLAAPDLLKRGFHPHAVLSNFGAAAVAAKLHRLDEEATLHTLAIALSHAAGTTEYSSTGGSIKRVHAGLGVRNGLLAAEMARAGITGPRAFLSGAKGFYRSFLQRDAGTGAGDWFKPSHGFQIEKIWLKPYCCCGCIHAYIDALAPHAGSHADIRRVRIRIQPSANVIVGTANANAWTPRNIEHVQFSLPIQLAFTLLGLGNGARVHHDYLRGALGMTTVMDTARRLELEVVPALDERYPGRFVADLTLEFHDGRTQDVFVDDPIGTAENPLPEAAQDAKFMELTVDVLGQARAATLLAALRTLDPKSTPGELTAMASA
ncbi:MAG: MmgE/PrpD family protein [Gammaproteobacteria bacterium]